jgi:hypothetical protein
MKEIKTTCGTIYTKKTKKGYQLLDSLKRVLIWDSPKKEIKKLINTLKLSSNIGDWLEQFDDVCWGTKEDVINYTKDYIECLNDNDMQVKFDKKWFESQYNKVGNTYILFEYSDCWIED